MGWVRRRIERSSLSWLTLTKREKRYNLGARTVMMSVGFGTIKLMIQRTSAVPLLAFAESGLSTNRYGLRSRLQPILYKH